MLVLQVIATAIILYYSYKWLSFRLKYDVHKLPCPPRLPLVGHLHHFVKMERLNQNKWFRDWYEKLGRPKIMLVSASPQKADSSHDLPLAVAAGRRRPHHLRRRLRQEQGPGQRRLPTGQTLQKSEQSVTQWEIRRSVRGDACRCLWESTGKTLL